MLARLKSTRALIILLLVLLAGWIVFITVQIGLNPLNRDRGGATVPELSDKLARALSEKDSGLLGSTLDPEVEHRVELAERYLEKAEDAEFVDARPVEGLAEDPVVLTRFRDHTGGFRCTTWNVISDGDRSYVDPTPGLASRGCG